MSTHHDTLTYLIAHPGVARTVKRASEQAVQTSLQGLLLSGLYKRAQALGEASKGVQHRFVQSMAEQDAKRRQAAAQAEARRNAAKRGLTGNKYYDNLPDVKARRESQNAAQSFDDYYKSRKDLVQEKDKATIAKEVGQVKSWGDTSIGRKVGEGLASMPIVRAVDWAGKGLGYLRSPKGTSWKEFSKQYDETSSLGRENLGRDIANNLQLWGEGVRHGAGTIGRWAQRAVDKGAYGDSTSAQLKRREYANMRANAAAAHNARVNGIVGNFDDIALRDGSSGIGKWNRIMTEGAGEVFGGELATAGIGGAAGAVGKGIVRGTRALSGAVRGAQAVSRAANAAGTVANAANAASTAASWGARAMQGARNLGSRTVQGARNMAARGIDAIGDTVAMPFNAAGTLASPSATGRAVASGARDVWHTARNAAKPVRDLYGLIRHPRAAMESFRATPYTHIWNGITYAPRWAWNTGKPIGRHYFSGKGYQAQTAYEAMRDTANGDYGSALGNLGGMGAYGALGPAIIPLDIARGVYSGGE